jgi:hypothetical protein
MYTLPYVIVGSAIVGMVLLFFQFEPWERGREILVLSLAVTAFVIAALCLYGLLFARPTTCRVLGGEWTEHGSCIHEWGGNGPDK